MDDESLPQSVGEQLLPPPPLLSEDETLCARLDDLYLFSGHKVKPSDMLRGAIYASRKECRSNPDWMSQAANSLREILYPFWRGKRKSEVFKNYGSVRIGSELTDEINKLFGLLNNLAHHGSIAPKFDFTTFTVLDFERLIADFTRIMRDALARQIDIHQEIDSVLVAGPMQDNTEE